MSSDQRNSQDDLVRALDDVEDFLTPVNDSARFRKQISEIERFRVVLDRTNDCIMLFCYPSLQIIDLNGSTCRNLGYTRHELINCPAHEVLPPETLKEISEFFERGSPVCESKSCLVTALRRKDNSSMPVEITLSVVHFGGEGYVVLVARDISERMEMEGAVRDAELQCRATMNAIRDAVVVCDRDVSVVICNKAFSDLCEKAGMPLPEQGVHLSVCAPYLTGELGLEYRYILSTGKPLITNVRHQTQFGELIFEVTKTPISEKDVVVRVVTVVRDITEQQQLEDMKKEAFEQIEQNMEQFAILNDHIRNPLQTIVGLADLEGGRAADQIILAAMEIDSMVKELDCGWLESGKIRDMLFRHYGIRPWTRRRLGLSGKDDGCSK